jgi:hypothetical protein
MGRHVIQDGHIRLRILTEAALGCWPGAPAFVSFDKKAVKVVQTHGEAARLLA